MVAHDLAREANPRQPPFREPCFLRIRDPLRLAADELDAARRAARIAATRVENVHAGLLYRKHEPLVVLDVNGREPFNGQLWHAAMLTYRVA